MSEATNILVCDRCGKLIDLRNAVAYGFEDDPNDYCKKCYDILAKECHTRIIPGTEDFIGRKLKPDIIEKDGDFISRNGYLVTRPDFYHDYESHINMIILIDKSFRITAVDGGKRYDYKAGTRGTYATSVNRPFSKKDLTYLINYLNEITEEP